MVQAVIACMDLVMLEKRYRHFLELWQQTDPEAEPERYQYYYQKNGFKTPPFTVSALINFCSYRISNIM
ncbi:MULTISPECIES: hypothetical protein [unclassified Nostoc]|uniref:hypothetical protein n=1 Tax=unclassified Nostoc TaxID=2593658 RepID=UPI002AD5276C|nr:MULTISPECIES: hypothetical protein [unclassified Nostoc]MDZ8032773.1 hypothetical protein [Nostoc sp. DedSLP04]MDZ8128624.1 hypothetical protein [Nostoc sp. DedQUE07]